MAAHSVNPGVAVGGVVGNGPESIIESSRLPPQVSSVATAALTAHAADGAMLMEWLLESRSEKRLSVRKMQAEHHTERDRLIPSGTGRNTRNLSLRCVSARQLEPIVKWERQVTSSV